MTAPEEASIKIGISSCLLGTEVRYDGGHTHNRYITDTLGEYFEYVSFCPEVAIGMGVPRPAIRLVKLGNEIRTQGIDDSSIDVTDDLIKYGHSLKKQIAPLSGYILKSRSPSCGMERVKVYGSKGSPIDKSSGMFAGSIMQDFPELPMEEEGRLMDPVLRENFIERVFVYHRWQNQCAKRLSAAKLVDFHTRHKFIVLSHDERAYRELGRLVAQAGQLALRELGQSYIQALMRALKKRATARKHSNVLMHMMGFIKNQMQADDKAELLDLIEDYRKGLVPLIVPVTLLQHYIRRHPDDYISQQYYMNPHPRELMLRNHMGNHI